ncbi:MAG: STAS domain-containing protein [Clostridia bacterium]|nr:STAS domain-containing protein [Clostridia bacterium]
MKILTTVQNGILHILLDGEIDEYSAATARHQTDRKIDECPPCDKAYIDLANVTFMDSTGIGFLIGRYKKLQRLGIKLYVVNPNPAADKILSLAGIYTLIPKA